MHPLPGALPPAFMWRPFRPTNPLFSPPLEELEEVGWLQCADDGEWNGVVADYPPRPIFIGIEFVFADTMYRFL